MSNNKNSPKRHSISSEEGKEVAASVLLNFQQNNAKQFKPSTTDNSSSENESDFDMDRMDSKEKDAISNTNTDKQSKTTVNTPMLYDELNKSPFYVYMDLCKDEPINQMRVSSTLMKMGYEKIDTVSKIGYKRCKIAFKCFREANKLATDPKIKEFDLKAFIPPNFTMKFGLIFGIPTEYSDEEILHMAVQDPLHPIKYVQRIKTKDKETKELIDTTRVKIGFKADYVPNEIKLGLSIMSCKYYLPFVRQCFKCQRFGHQAGQCKSKFCVCVNCGEKHSKENCVASSKKCANCGENHPATERTCSARATYCRIQKLMILKNLNYNEAKKLTKEPIFKYHDKDFPILGSANPPNNQEIVNKTLLADKSFNRIVKNKQREYHIIDTTPQHIEPPRVFQEISREGPVFASTSYTQNISSASERCLKELKNIVSNLNLSNRIEVLKEFAYYITNENIFDEQLNDKSGDNTQLSQNAVC